MHAYTDAISYRSDLYSNLILIINIKLINFEIYNESLYI